MYVENRLKLKRKRGVRGVSPRTKKHQLNSFLFSVKPISLVEEKGNRLGFEPVAKFLPSARSKLGINLVHDTAFLQG